MLDNKPVLRKAARAVSAAAAALLASAALYAVYLLVGVPSWKQALLLVAGVFAVLVAAAVVWDAWDRTDVLSIELRGQIAHTTDGPFSDKLDGKEFVGEIKTADREDDHDALLVEISSPGGEVTPSAEMYRAIKAFDGPTVACVEDTCASGAYLAAAACDRIYTLEDATVGSIGVLASQINASDLADDLGLNYEGYTAGDLKDAGHPLKDPSEEEREFIQSMVDEHYERFVSRVAETRPMDEDDIRELGARVVSGEKAVENGLADVVGDREDALEYLEVELGAPAPGDDEETSLAIRESRQGGVFDAGTTAERAAYALGQGIACRMEATVEDTLQGGRFR